MIYRLLIFVFIFNGCSKTSPEQVSFCPYGLPVSKRPLSVLRHRGYTVGYWERAKVALWVCEKVEAISLTGPATRKSLFKADPLLPASRQASNADYDTGGYDRGHLAPADNRDRDQTLKNETFYLTNMAPQLPAFNRGIWKVLEEKVREWAKLYGTVYVISGFLGKKKAVIGKSRVWVPKRFFKIIVRPAPLTALAFVLEHRAYSPPHKLALYLVSIRSIEKATGLNFMPQLQTATQDAVETKSAADLWRKE